MTTQFQNRFKKLNQLIFVEYENPTKEGHLITITDSYRNSIGKIHRTYDDKAKAYTYTAYDHIGKAMQQTENLDKLKKEIISNRDQLLKDAHQRRIASKEVAQEGADKPKVQSKSNRREITRDKTSKVKEKQNPQTEHKPHDEIEEGKKAETPTIGEEELNPNNSDFEEREQEVDGLREENEVDRDDHDLER